MAVTTKPLRTTGQAARELGLAPWQLLRFLALGRLPDVSRVGSLRAWTDADIRRARELLAAESESKSSPLAVGRGGGTVRDGAAQISGKKS